jgi:plastocyanin
MIQSLVPLLLAFQASAGVIEGKVRLEGGPNPDDHSMAVVFVSGYSEDGKGTSGKVVQKGLQFHPPTLPITKGGVVEFVNEDVLSHNVFSTSKAKAFDLGTQARGETQKVSFDNAGVVNVFCNIHPDMSSVVLVLPNKAFALTGRDGSYRITGVKPGKHKLVAYHYLGKTVSEDVAVKAGETAGKDFQLKLVKAPRPHLNKHGKPYSEKRRY